MKRTLFFIGVSVIVALLVAQVVVGNKPVINKVATPDGVELKTLTPGQRMVIVGVDFCQARTAVPLPIDANAKYPTSWGCRARIDDKLVINYAGAFTSYQDGSSFLDVVLPDGISDGTHNLTVERFDIKDDAVVVQAVSDSFTITVQVPPDVSAAKKEKKKK